MPCCALQSTTTLLALCHQCVHVFMVSVLHVRGHAARISILAPQNYCCCPFLSTACFSAAWYWVFFLLQCARKVLLRTGNLSELNCSMKRVIVSRTLVCKRLCCMQFNGTAPAPNEARSSLSIFLDEGVAGCSATAEIVRVQRVNDTPELLEVLISTQTCYIGGIVLCLLYTSPSPRD